jgi:alkaline phosphatase
MARMLRKLLFLSLALATLCLAQSRGRRAKNVILFLADAGGLPAVNAASLHGYGEPQKLFLQSWPNTGFSDTSTASRWVTDSAAGMTAIVTGVKTHNGVISMGPDTVRGQKDGTKLKTILEHAEQRGLSTGVISNVNIADATPASCYAQSNDRRKHGEIFLQIFTPRFGDGVDVVMGVGRKAIYDNAVSIGKDIDAAAKQAGRTVWNSLAEAETAKRPIVVLEKDLDVPAAARRALKELSSNRKGYFLMIEWDAHTTDPKRGLDNIVGLDKLMREIASTVNLKETLLLFTADHSFQIQLTGGTRGEPILTGNALTTGKSHTGEEVVAAALGAGSEQVRGFFPNTRLFQVMWNAFGWKADAR